MADEQQKESTTNPKLVRVVKNKLVADVTRRSLDGWLKRGWKVVEPQGA